MKCLEKAPYRLEEVLEVYFALLEVVSADDCDCFGVGFSWADFDAEGDAEHLPLVILLAWAESVIVVECGSDPGSGQCVEDFQGVGFGDLLLPFDGDGDYDNLFRGDLRG